MDLLNRDHINSPSHTTSSLVHSWASNSKETAKRKWFITGESSSRPVRFRKRPWRPREQCSGITKDPVPCALSNSSLMQTVSPDVNNDYTPSSASTSYMPPEIDETRCDFSIEVPIPETVPESQTYAASVLFNNQTIKVDSSTFFLPESVEVQSMYFVVICVLDNDGQYITCSCNRERSDFIKANHELMVVSVDDECLHIRGFRHMDIDVQVNPSPQDHSDYPIRKVFVQPTDSMEGHFAAFDGYTHGFIVGLGDGRWKCLVCRSEYCSHATIPQDNTLLTEHEATVLSDYPTPPFRLKSQYEMYSLSSSSINAFISKQVPIPDILHVSTEGVCECGRAWIDAKVITERCLLLQLNRSKEIEVTELICKCTKEKYLDGSDYDVLNMGSYLFTNDLFRAHFCDFLTDGRRVHSFFKSLVWTYLRNGTTLDITYPLFLHSWYQFLALLDINQFINSGFECPTCASAPDTIICDGVTLGMRKIHMPEKPKTVGKYPANFDGCFHMQVFLPLAKTRKLLTKFRKDGLTVAEMAEVRQSSPVYMNELLDTFISEQKYKCPEPMKPFLKFLSSDFPVSATLHPEDDVLDAVVKVANETHIGLQDRKSLQTKCPVLYRLFCSFAWEIPEYLRPILHELVNRARYPFLKGQHMLPQKEMEDDLCFFPTLTKHCERGVYVLDGHKHKSGDEIECDKVFTRHRTLTPGLFIVSCKHGVCYGYHLMRDLESPDIAFTILRTRFENPPKLVIYDNGCKLHRYALNRDPSFFKFTWFVVDRFHWRNHTACPCGYNLSEYPQYDNINTQVAEQRNATLKKLRSLLSVMDFFHYEKHLQLFLWFRNMITMCKMNRDYVLDNFPFGALLYRLAQHY